MKNKTIILYVKLFMILSLFIGFQKCTPQEKNSDIQPIVVGMLGKVNAIPYYKEHVESEGADWYYFPVTAGTQYTIKCRDSRDTNTDCCSADIVVSAYDSNGNTIFSQADNGFTTPHVFVASITGYVYVKVEPKLISGGTYQIRFRSP